MPEHRLDLLAQVGALQLPIPGLTDPARLRAGPGAYPIVGDTHTTASLRVMDATTDLLSAPVMPWDAFTSAADRYPRA